MFYFPLQPFQTSANGGSGKEVSTKNDKTPPHKIS